MSLRGMWSSPQIPKHRWLVLGYVAVLLLAGCGRDPYSGTWHRVGSRKTAVINGITTRIPATIRLTRKGECQYTIREDSQRPRPAWSANCSSLIAYERDVGTWEISYDWASGHLVMTYDSGGSGKDVVVEYER